MTLQQLRYLIGVVDSGLNITAAAERLFASQPGISKQLRQLEAELGVQLFTRRGKSLAALTESGEHIVTRARRILQEVQNIRSLAGEVSSEKSGTLAIATTHTQARYVLPDVIRQFRERYPDVTLELHQGTSEQIAELVDAGRVDVAIATGALDLFPGMTVLPCFRWRRIALVPRDHELAASTGPLSVQELARHPLVTYVFAASGESSFKRAFATNGLEANVVFTARDADVIKTYVGVGMGVGVLAPMAYECDDDLVPLDVDDAFGVLTTWLGFRRDAVIKGYMAEFATLFAPHLTARLIKAAHECETPDAVDRLFTDIALPERFGCATRATSPD
ncbi:MAG: LysR substrate-binding domain-containing protein [Gammaproteobacteria bacterium]